MASKVHHWIIALLILVTGCRDTDLVEVRRPTEGYQIEGTVLDGLDQPVIGVAIKVSYGMDFVSSSPQPQREYILQSPGEYVVIDVYDLKNRLVRNLAAESPSGPSFYRPWDKRNNSGNLVRSGVYIVRYVVDGAVRHSYPVLVDGHVTATTDANGVFSISDDSLPVGYYPVPLYTGTDAFVGNYRINNVVYLELTIGTTTHRFGIILRMNEVTRLAVRVQ
ncbi:MAG: hypothetical protein HY563_04350 [Ignavibacteriales bacterium]|nr:hypothetical protein [Ignavibacteriales bacterium]